MINFRIMNFFFGFLFDLKKLKSAKDDRLMVFCVNLEAFLKHDIHLILKIMIYYEIKGSKRCFYQKKLKSLSMYWILWKKNESCYLNTWITYHKMITNPVSVIIAKESFSKLKLIKLYCSQLWHKKSWMDYRRVVN